MMGAARAAATCVEPGRATIRPRLKRVERRGLPGHATQACLKRRSNKPGPYNAKHEKPLEVSTLTTGQKTSHQTISDRARDLASTLIVRGGPRHTPGDNALLQNGTGRQQNRGFYNGKRWLTFLNFNGAAAWFRLLFETFAPELTSLGAERTHSRWCGTVVMVLGIVFGNRREGGRLGRAPVVLAVAGAVAMIAAAAVVSLFPQRAWAADSTLPVAGAARLAGDDQRTRFVMDINRAVAFRIFALPDPYRVVVDLPEIEFSDPSAADNAGRGLVSAYRFGRFAPGKSRIVLDAREPFRIDKAFVLEPVEGQPARFVVDLVPADRLEFMRELALSVPSKPEEPADKPARPAAAVPLQAVPPGGTQGRKPMIIVDAGHGGVDSGAIGKGGTLEKDIVLQVARRVADRLEATGKYRVRMTRDDDRFIRLGDRVDIAREAEASLLISIHADAIDYAGIGGATVYTRSDKASDRAAEMLADRENRADLIAGVDLSEESDEVAGILFDLVRRETHNFSTIFARGLVHEFKGKVKLIKNPLRSARFHVLAAPDVPSVLVELGYLTNPKDEKTMQKAQWQDTVSAAIVESVSAYFGRGVAKNVN